MFHASANSSMLQSSTSAFKVGATPTPHANKRQPPLPAYENPRTFGYVARRRTDDEGGTMILRKGFLLRNCRVCISSSWMGHLHNPCVINF